MQNGENRIKCWFEWHCLSIYSLHAVHPQVWKNNTGQNYSVPHGTFHSFEIIEVFCVYLFSFFIFLAVGKWAPHKSSFFFLSFFLGLVNGHFLFLLIIITDWWRFLLLLLLSKSSFVGKRYVLVLDLPVNMDHLWCYWSHFYATFPLILSVSASIQWRSSDDLYFCY